MSLLLRKSLNSQGRLRNRNGVGVKKYFYTTEKFHPVGKTYMGLLGNL